MRTSFDLTDCAREKIHRLGAVQSHGSLVAVRAGVVEAASDNTGALLGISAADLIGSPLGRLLDTADIAATLPPEDPASSLVTGQAVLMRPRMCSEPLAVTPHTSDGLSVLEFEPVIHGPATLSVASISRTLHRLQSCASVVETCQAAVLEIRAMTGYDRVVAYRFAAPDGPGEVIAEAVPPGVDPWLGLWFPAVDIPPQARELYRRNWIRVIADVDDPGAAIVPAALPATGEPLDLSWSVLRMVSGYHLEYLRNIGVRSSMSVSLMDGEHLWGLIACHGHRPRRLSPEQRSACELLGTALSLHLGALRQRDDKSVLERARAELSRTVRELAGVPFPPGDLDPLARLIDSAAIVIRTGTGVRHAGHHPGEAALALLWQVVPPIEAGQVWCHDHLTALDAGFAAWAATLSGVLILGLGHGDRIMWIRGEQVVRQRWAVDPDRPVQTGPQGQRLTPRGSSAAHSRAVRRHSLPWTEADVTVATELGRQLGQVLLAHTAELARLNDRLARSNRELEFFAYAAAHDLKEPLRGMARTADALAEETAGQLPETASNRVAAIQRLSHRMSRLLQTLLQYALAGRQSFHHQPVDLRVLVDRAIGNAGTRLSERGLTVRLPEPGAHILWVDPDAFEQVFVNLLVNAAKYARNDEPDRWVAIGVNPATPPGESGEVPVIYVQDNGIGIPPVRRSSVFGLFSRYHQPGHDNDGVGAGLAIARRLVEEHDGRIWLQDDPGAATSIRIALPPHDAPMTPPALR